MAQQPDPSATPPTAPGVPSPPDDTLRQYHKVADTIGGLPNLRVRDNVYQTLFIVGLGLICAGVGALLGANKGVEWYIGAAIGGVAGVIIATFVSGMFLMVLGFVRAAKKD